MSIPGQQIINVGAPNNPVNSDSLFQAFTTINNNFATLFSTSSPITTISAGSGIDVSNSTSAAYQITNTGVTSLIAGQNVTITTLGGSPGSNGALVISSIGSTGNGGGGTVDSVGVTSNTISVLNSPITTTGNIQIDLPVISTVSGSYVNANLTVDQFGRIVSASNGSASGSVTGVSVSGGTGIAISGSPITTSGTITVTNTGVTSIVAGSGIAINQANGAVTITNTGGGGSGGGTVTRVGVVSNSLTVSGSPVISSGNIQIDLPANLSANVLVATTANLSTINTNRFTMVSGNGNALTLTSSTNNSSVSSIISEKSRGNVTNPSAAVVNDSLLSISSKAYTTFNTYQNAGGFSVVLTGAAPNGSSTVSSRAVMSSTSNTNVSYSLSVEETGNTFIPGRIQTQQSSNIAQIPAVFLARARGTDGANVSQVQVGDSIGRVIGYGYSGNGTTSVGGVSGYTVAGSTEWTVAGLPASSGSQLSSNYTIRTVSASNVTLSSIFSNTGNLSIPGTFIGNGLAVTGNISSGNISATANISAGNIIATANISSGNISATANISAGNISVIGGMTASTISGSLTTAAQPNVTSVGTLSSLTVTGNITSGGIKTDDYFYANGATVPIGYGNSNVGLFLTSYTGNIAAGNISITGVYTGNGSGLSSITSANVNYLAPYTGSVSRTQNSKNSDTVSVKDFGAVGNGTTNDTAAIQAAIATGKRVYVPTGDYLITNGLNCATPGQIIYGDGQTRTTFVVNNTFNLSAQGVFIFSSGEPGASLRDLGIEFVQPDTATRASLVNYPPAVYAVNQPRFTIINCRISNAMTGIDMTGNSGGAMIDSVNMSCYNFGIRIDGSLDTVRISRLQYWPFDMSVNQTSIFFDANNCGIQSGRCDDLKINSCLFINGGVQVELLVTASGSTFGAITDTDFDTYASLAMAGGNMVVTSCYFTIGASALNYNAISLTGGYMRVVGCEFEIAAPGTTVPLVSCAASSGAVGGAYMQLSTSLFRNSGVGQSLISLTVGTMICSDNQFVVGVNQSWTNALVSVSGAQTRITFSNNRSSDKGTGTGNLISINTNNYHIVTNNSFMGWGSSYPGSQTLMVVANNGA